MIEWLAIGGYALYQLLKNDGGESQPPPPEPSRPRKIIALVGRTGAGKSSTANALLGCNFFATSAAHGTTVAVADHPYHSGFVLRDTPGSMDDINFLPTVWPALEESAIVVYTVSSQLYRVELEFLEDLQHRQRFWDTANSCRRLVLYVNQRDVWEATSSGAEIRRAEAAIRSQVAPSIESASIVFGAAAPQLNGVPQPPRIDALRSLLSQLMTDF